MQIADPSAPARPHRSRPLRPGSTSLRVAESASGRGVRLPVLAVPILAMLVCSVLAGCKLVDQRTFDASAGRRPIPHLPPAGPAPPPPLPLASVHYQADPATWQPGLADIVRMALARKPEALFQVETLVPSTGTPEAQAASLAAAGRSGGQAVAETIVSAGASTGQVEMSARTDPSVQRPEVRVFVK